MHLIVLLFAKVDNIFETTKFNPKKFYNGHTWYVVF